MVLLNDGEDQHDLKKNAEDDKNYPEDSLNTVTVRISDILQTMQGGGLTKLSDLIVRIRF